MFQVVPSPCFFLTEDYGIEMLQIGQSSQRTFLYRSVQQKNNYFFSVSIKKLIPCCHLCLSKHCWIKFQLKSYQLLTGVHYIQHNFPAYPYIWLFKTALFSNHPRKKTAFRSDPKSVNSYYAKHNKTFSQNMDYVKAEQNVVTGSKILSFQFESFTK